MIKKILLALFLGILLTIFYAQQDQWVHTHIVQLLQQISRDSLQGSFECTIESINFFSPSIIFSHVKMKSNSDKQWSWECKKLEIHGSWLQLFFKGIMDQHIVMEDFECITHTENCQFSIMEHIQCMMKQTPNFFTTQIKSAFYKNGTLTVLDNSNNISATILFNSSSLRVKNQIKTTMSISDGSCRHHENKIIEKYTADLSFITEYKKEGLDINMHIAGNFIVPQLKQQGICYITGGYQSEHARFSIRNAYNSLVIDPIIVTKSEIRINAQLPLWYCASFFIPSCSDQIKSGIAHFSIKINPYNGNKIDGHLMIEDFKTKQMHMCDISKIIFSHQEEEWKFRLLINRYNQELKGAGYWNKTTQKGDISLKNSTDLFVKAFTHWRIKHNNFCLHATIDDNAIEGSCTAQITNSLNSVNHIINSNFSHHNGIITTTGTLDNNSFYLQAKVSPELNINTCTYKNEEGIELVNIHTKKNNIDASIGFPIIKSLLHSYCNYDAQGEGTLNVSAMFSPTTINADLRLQNATIRLGHTYNFIDGLTAHCTYNIQNNSCIFYQTTISLHTGAVNCLYATLHFNEKGSLVFAHAPLIFNHCLFNIKKDLFAIVSGSLFFSQTKNLPGNITGSIIIDKGCLKENLFSGVIQKQLFSYTHSIFSLPNIPIQCNIDIMTKSPITVDTGFFKTNAHAQLTMQKYTHEPSISGAIILQSGTLNFPYKPLYITKGRINFIPEQLFDPLIELVARNKIKKYDVSLQVEGSLLNHHIALDANPALSEEQIIGLLLIGSEEQSLNTMMPALLAQNLKNFIFTHNQASFFDKYFKPLLGSFNINLVPSFSDQTGRGGLRGAVEITVNDRWRAFIQKNFSLTEDTKFELEFLLSDDITLRAIRDERRDLGGEIEMRWKF